MGANLLTVDSVLMCPHGGTVVAIPSSPRASMGGATVVYATDTFVIAGCPFTLGPAPHPCVQVKWVQPAARSTVNGNATLTEASVGLCVAADQSVQGTVQVVTTQSQVSGL